MTIGQDHRLDDSKENEGSGRRTREGSTHGGLGRGRRVCEGTVRAEQETRTGRPQGGRCAVGEIAERQPEKDRNVAGPRPRKTGDEDGGGAVVAPENDAPLTPHPKRPRNGHHTRESRAKHTQPKKCRITDDESNEEPAHFTQTRPLLHKSKAGLRESLPRAHPK